MFNNPNFFKLATREGIAVIVVGNIIASKFGNLSISSVKLVIISLGSGKYPNAKIVTFSFTGVPLSTHSLYSS